MSKQQFTIRSFFTLKNTYTAIDGLGLFTSGFKIDKDSVKVAEGMVTGTVLYGPSCGANQDDVNRAREATKARMSVIGVVLTMESLPRIPFY